MSRKLLLATVLLITLLSACTSQTASEVTKAPDFTLPNALGGEVSLRDYAGKPIFLFFHMAVG